MWVGTKHKLRTECVYIKVHVRATLSLCGKSICNSNGNPEENKEYDVREQPLDLRSLFIDGSLEASIHLFVAGIHSKGYIYDRPHLLAPLDKVLAKVPHTYANLCRHFLVVPTVPSGQVPLTGWVIRNLKSRRLFTVPYTPKTAKGEEKSSTWFRHRV